MATMTLTVGELTITLSDHSRWLSRRRLRAWQQFTHELLNKLSSEEGVDVTSITEVAGEEEPDDDLEEDEDRARPRLGFRSR